MKIGHKPGKQRKPQSVRNIRSVHKTDGEHANAMLISLRDITEWKVQQERLKKTKYVAWGKNAINVMRLMTS